MTNLDAAFIESVYAEIPSIGAVAIDAPAARLSGNGCSAAVHDQALAAIRILAERGRVGIDDVGGWVWRIEQRWGDKIQRVGS